MAIQRSGASTIVGLLACQKEPFLRSLKTTVVACQKAASGAYEVEFENTILFPEGGGQPTDHGIVKLTGDSATDDNSRNIQVTNVQRDGLTAVHFLDKELTPGSSVELIVDWPRRVDHMQQHTGQHLLSAVLDKRNLETLGWNLGAKFCYIELPRKLTPQEVEEVQDEVNDLITQTLPITVETHSEHSQKQNVDHKVPENYDLSQGVVRVIHIGGIDSNPCCGTHLTNTGQIGSLALLHAQPIRGTNSRLFFVAGNRVHKYASEANSIVRKANSLLSCQTEDIEDKINRLNALVKELSTRERSWQAQLAQFQAQKIKADLSGKPLVVFHNPDPAAVDFLKFIDKELGKFTEGTVILFCGQGKQGGSIFIIGNDVDSYSTKAKELVPNAKGGGKGRWQAKVLSYDKGAVEAILALSE